MEGRTPRTKHEVNLNNRRICNRIYDFRLVAVC
jgi:hypothetical protein